MAPARLCSSSALAMPVKPRASSRSDVGCGMWDVSAWGVSFSVVILLALRQRRDAFPDRRTLGATYVGVLQRQLVSVWFQERLIEPVLQD